MRDPLYVGIALLICCLSCQSQANPPGAVKPPSPTDSLAGAQALPTVCSKTNPPLRCATPPHVVSSPSPEASEQVGATEVKGVCVLKIVVEADGSTSHVRVMEGLGMGLDEKAIEAVKKWKFSPAMLKGKPVAVEIAVEVDFPPWLNRREQKQRRVARRLPLPKLLRL